MGELGKFIVSTLLALVLSGAVRAESVMSSGGNNERLRQEVLSASIGKGIQKPGAACRNTIYVSGSGGLFSGGLSELATATLTEGDYSFWRSGRDVQAKLILDNAPAGTCLIIFSLGAAVAHPYLDINIGKFRTVCVDCYITSVRVWKQEGWPEIPEPGNVESMIRSRLSGAYKICQSDKVFGNIGNNMAGSPHTRITSDVAVIQAVRKYLSTGTRTTGPIGSARSC